MYTISLHLGTTGGPGRIVRRKLIRRGRISMTALSVAISDGLTLQFLLRLMTLRPVPFVWRLSPSTERQYFATLKKGRGAKQNHLDYFTALEHEVKMKATYDVARAANTTMARDIAILKGAKKPELTPLQRTQTWAVTRLDRAEENSHGIQQRLGFGEPWTPSLPLYIETTVFVRDRKYLKAVDTLERLVVQRIFELTKMNLSGTGK